MSIRSERAIPARLLVSLLAAGVAALGCAEDVDPGPGVGGEPQPLSCDPVVEAARSDEPVQLPPPPARSLADRPVRLAVVAPRAGRSLPDVQRLMTQVEGWGYPATLLRPEEVSADLEASAIVVASSAYELIEADSDTWAALDAACGRGVDLVWLGLGLPPALAHRFGVEPMEPAPANELGVSAVEWGPGADTAMYALQEMEWVQPSHGQGAEVLSSFDDGTSLLSTHRTPGACRATALTFAFGDYWSESDAEASWLRAEMLHEAITRGASSGLAAIEPFPAGTTGVFMIRFEDIHPGGTRFSIATDDFIERFDRAMELLRDLDYGISLSIVPMYVDPGHDDRFAWDDPSMMRAQLRDALARALSQNAALIAHGYTHQYGERDTDYTGVDWEMSDDTSGEWVFLPYEQQRGRIEASRDELSRIFGIIPRVWETPHLDGDINTYQAASDVGFPFVNEEDGHLFPNRSGYEGRVAGTMLNLPHTGSFVPTGPEAEDWVRAPLHHVMPRLVRTRAPFFFFYHGYDDYQEGVLHTLSSCASEAGLWGPTVEEMADRWVVREAAEVNARHEDEDTLVLEVLGAPERGLLTVRLPEGRRAAEIRVDGAPIAEHEVLYRAGAQWVRVPLPGPDARVEVRHGR